MMPNIKKLMHHAIQEYRDTKRTPMDERATATHLIGMNELRDEDVVTQQIIDEIIQNFWEYVREVDIVDSNAFTKIDLLTDLKSKADHYVNNHNHQIDQRIVEATVVSFINWVGICMAVDYALYTKDLKTSSYPKAI